MRGPERVYKRGNVWWVEYWIRNVQYRESSRSTRESVARTLLKQRIGEVTSDTFIEPQEKRVTVDDLLDALAADYRNAMPDRGFSIRTSLNGLSSTCPTT